MANTCSFCGQALTVRKKIIAGPGVSICDHCVAVFHRILAQEGLDLTLRDESPNGISSVALQNVISDVRTLSVQPSSGPTPAIVMGLNIPDPQSADIFIQEVAEKFKLQLLCSPPDTSILLVTMVSDMPASSFVERWHQLAVADKILTFFISKLRQATVFRNTGSGQTLESVSLIPEPSS